ncbi:hypothetical protein [Polynucleobacter sp. IMCC 30228]|uniref:DUF6969 family protein n=1 Tax=Polynucleobacter sp. IMCC 30228 TaxID=2781011 RepID=UPI001F3567CC|nr:hypothetical protein [Polynucleobacter sp. IMCC 30228]MCE7527308.1 hypothetical protein [Polynucleobacter sp. IMCC 30228]
MLTQSILCLAAQELLSVQTKYAKKGLTLSQAALCGAKQFVEWRHYPSKDLVDGEGGCEFYYHAHAADEMQKGEHGHFHLFKRSAKQPNHFFHLIGIALDQKGLPVRLFTTNQWVTGEQWAKAPTVIAALQDFDVSVKGPLGPLGRWVSALTTLFYVEMRELIVKRDRKITALAIKDGNKNLALENRKYHVLTEQKIHYMDRLADHLFV